MSEFERWLREYKKRKARERTMRKYYEPLPSKPLLPEVTSKKTSNPEMSILELLPVRYRYVEEISKTLKAKPTKTIWKGKEFWQALDGTITRTEEEARNVNREIAKRLADLYIYTLKRKREQYRKEIERIEDEIRAIEDLARREGMF